MLFAVIIIWVLEKELHAFRRIKGNSTREESVNGLDLVILERIFGVGSIASVYRISLFGRHGYLCYGLARRLV